MASASGRPNWVEKAGVLIGVGTVAVAVLALVLGSGSGTSSSAPSNGMTSPANLKIVNLVVQDQEPWPHPDSLEVLLHNVGGQTVVIDRATFQINRIYELPRCASQGDVPLSETYGLALPADAQPGSRVSTDLHQQVGPDEADRFGIAVSLHRPKNRTDGTLYLFKGTLTLHTDAPRPQVSVGKLLLSLPLPPASGEYYWNARTPKLIRGLLITSPNYGRELERFSMKCWQENTQTLENVLATKGSRSQWLRKVPGELVTPSLAAIE